VARIYRKILEIQHIQPSAPIQIGDMYYCYDAAGNRHRNRPLLLIKENSKNAHIFIGGYAGATIGFEVDWKSQCFEDWTKTFSLSIPLGMAEISVGDNSFGFGVGVGKGFAFDTSPTSYIKSLSLSYEEYHVINMMIPLCGKVDFDRENDFITDENNIIIGYQAVATIYTTNGKVKIPVQCGITDSESRNPTELWETLLYKQNKLNE
jgi:hypothetical protein